MVLAIMLCYANSFSKVHPNTKKENILTDGKDHNLSKTLPFTSFYWTSGPCFRTWGCTNASKKYSLSNTTAKSLFPLFRAHNRWISRVRDWKEYFVWKISAHTYSMVQVINNKRIVNPLITVTATMPIIKQKSRF